MRIAQFIDSPDIGGAETMVLNLSRELTGAGEQVVIWHLDNPYIAEMCEKYQLDHKIVPGRKLYRSVLTVPFFSLLFAHALWREKVDILHTHLYGAITSSFPGTYLFGIPHIGTLHDVYMVKERAGRGLLLRIAQAANTRLVAVSKDMKHFYEKYIFASKCLCLIHNGVVLKDIAKEYAPVFDEIDKSDSIRIVSVGRLVKLKNYFSQVAALTPIVRQYNVQLLIVGDGSEYEDIRRLIDEEGLQNKVHLLGERDDVYSVLKSSDIFILSSESEGLSCSIIEAMASGLPSLVSNVGGNSELIVPGVNGDLYDVEDHEQFRTKLVEMINDREQRARMGREGREIAEKRFSSKVMTVNYLNEYREMAS